MHDGLLNPICDLAMRHAYLRSLLPIFLASVGLIAGCGPVDDDDHPSDVGGVSDTAPTDAGAGDDGGDPPDQSDIECTIPMEVPEGLDCFALRPPEPCEPLVDCSPSEEWSRCPDETAAPISRLTCDSDVTIQRVAIPTTRACPTAGEGLAVRLAAIDSEGRPVGPKGVPSNGRFLFEVAGGSDLIPLEELTDEQENRVERIVVKPSGGASIRSATLADPVSAAPPHRPCTSSQCQTDGYMCADPAGQDRPEYRRCIRRLDAITMPARSVSEDRSRQFFGLLVENGASVQGYLPDPIGSLYYDADGDGSAEVSPSSFASELATDADGRRKSAMSQLVRYLSDYQGGWLAPDDLETHFGLWAIEGAKVPTSYVEEAAGSAWTTNPQQMLAAADAFSEAQASNRRSNIIEAARHMIDGPLADGSLDGAEKTLVLVVDGPPEVIVDPDKIGGLKAAAARSDVRIFVVHYDPALPRDKLRDDPAYYNGHDGGCNVDAGCQSRETCREVKGYHPQRGGEVDRSAGEHRSGTFCMPRRESDGRVGPIHYYGQLTCETDGAYYYRRSNAPLSRLLEYLPATMDGYWEARAEQPVGLSEGLSEGTPIKVGGRLRVDNPTGVALESYLGVDGAAGDGGETAAQDNRGVIFAEDR